ncbi:MAG TPA: PIN domain-containing protein [Edaphobacter sp.]|nr:PIN domain-containing protein [Edaphobacter sp.]
MILVDSSVWVDHLRRDEAGMRRLLGAGQVLSHPFVIGELAMGRFNRRDLLLKELMDLPSAKVAEDDEVLQFVSRYRLFESGVGYIDAHLLAAVRLMPGTLVWTRDKRLFEVASNLGLAAAER